MSQVTKSFEEHNIIPDVLPAGTQVPHNLGIHWPKVNLRAPGDRLHRDEVQETPTITTDLKPKDDDTQEYVLLMVDPDLTHYNDRTFGQVRHWLVPKVKLSSDGNVSINQAATISPYVGPAPLAAHLVVGESRPSRYTFLLLKHRTAGPPAVLDPDTLKAHYEGDAGQFGGEMQNVIDRMGFDTAVFMQKNGLEVVAGTFMFVEGNVKSTLANAGLLATGVAQKVAGQ
ncbi:hypothetical protein MCOR07_008312 [Pyricularia oryzae]|uniref:PEBP-like protein n=1 Tax=Pyricularia grisea TaxID=148305 RepID=A0ABQ8NYS3_PYRGI|nr:hypothetical protein MCOR26_003693 [Pyricularia oryzae]KAI6303782.1 hypothetical protein MCOR33_001134 [Pyricularia grisea]KAI6329799.1 hypothetical protein MCOR29_002136 [Pyricularia oryzae]KAI6330668.1 hypothetical protein MCOR30_005078 [Pyricularia oryzae]KAI6343812.1 hypothetical protein MCOR28_004605 [Pyricularia oryzae]